MKAVFGAGCFWSVQEEFDKVKGVTSSFVGYMGGVTKDPDYSSVCSGKTGHSEVVYLEFNPKIVSYEKLLNVFFSIHDPSINNKTQYKSVIFYYDNSQRIKANNYKSDLIKGGINVVTEIIPVSVFYKAENYHQKYYLTHGGVCH